MAGLGVLGTLIAWGRRRFFSRCVIRPRMKQRAQSPPICTVSGHFDTEGDGIQNKSICNHESA